MTVLRTVLDNSVAFSLLFVGVWLVKASLRKHLSARLHYVVWAAVLVTLLIPVRNESISLWNLLPRQTTDAIVVQTQNLQPLAEIINGSNASSGKATLPQGQPAATDNAPIHSPATSGNSQPLQPQPSNPLGHINWPTVLLACWLAGMAATGLWLSLGSLRLRRQIIRCSAPRTPYWLEASAKECTRVLRMRQNVRIVVQPVLSVPAVMGVLHPILAMPEAVVKERDEEHIRHILMHEFNHVRRGDLIVIASLNLLNAVYWFNPLVWLCFKLIRADMEMSCDNDVVHALGRRQRQEYIRTLVTFAAMEGPSHAKTALSLYDARVQMKRRIGAMFMTKKTKPALAVPVVLLVLVLLAAASVTGCLPTAASADVVNPSATAAVEEPSPTPVLANTANSTATKVPSDEPQTTEASPSPSPAEPSPAPAQSAQSSASQWETAYQPVLEEYRALAERFSENGGQGDFSDLGAPWDQIAPDMMYSTQKFGYALRDMDGNGTPELFWLTSDGTIWAMYTFVDDAPKQLGVFWSRNACLLDQSDVIYMSWSNGALDNGQDAYQISADGQSLALVKRVAMESTGETGAPLAEPRTYKCVGSQDNKEIITEAEAAEETAAFPQNNEESGLDFVSLR